MRSGSVSVGLVGALLMFTGAAGCSANGATSSPATIPQSTSRAAQRAVQGVASTANTRATLFYDDFEHGSLQSWTAQGFAKWSVCQPPGGSQELCTPARPLREQSVATAGSQTWTNYEVDAWTVPGSATIGGLELVGRYVDADHFYQLELHNLGGGQFWGIYKLSGPTWTQLAGGPITYLAARYYHLRLILNGSTLTAYATTAPNDFRITTEKLLGSAIDTTYASGKIGVRAIDGVTTRFDNVGVYSMSSPAPAPPQAPPANVNLTLPSGFYADAIATLPRARQLAVANNGDLLVGTKSAAIMVVPNAESDGMAGPAQTLITLPEAPAQGIALGPNGTLYAGTNTAVWAIPYTPGTLAAPAARKIASIRTGPIAPDSDGDVHTASSVIVSGKTLYVGIGSSCNACTEVDSTRATVQAMNLDGSGMHTYAKRIRNPIAFTTDPATGAVFTGGAGQDSLPAGHPYEYLDALTAHPAGADYGWPACEENHVAYTAGSNCANTVQPIIEFPAFSTIVGAAYYPTTATGTYAFPAAYRGGMFVSMHGSWHSVAGIPIDGPHVAFVAMNGDVPAKSVNWNDPTAQWTDFFANFQYPNGLRIGRTTGLAVGPRGSLFVADDQSGTIYRIRPGIRQ